MIYSKFLDKLIQELVCKVSIQKRSKILKNVDMTAFLKTTDKNPTSLLTQNFVFFALRVMWGFFIGKQIN
ncbi:hypothetical protein DVZ94_06455 [Staphylococcus pseudintermedius]|nr:hypothetical protein [Staphylococcus pseudintermedius]